MPALKQKSKTKRPKRTVIAREVAGSLHGYASTWAVDENYHTQFMPGCWVKSIMERVTAIPIMLVHFRDGGDVMEQIGILKGAHEDDLGLSVSGGFLTDELSALVRSKVKAGAPRGLSVGFRTIQSYTGEDEIEHITEAQLVEVTITNNPSDPNARIIDARNAEPSPPDDKAGDTQRRKAELVKLGLELDLLEID